MTDKLRIELKSSTAGVDQLADSFDRFSARHRLPAGVHRAVRLALDEVVSNIIHHGHGDRSDHVITVELRLTRDALRVEVVDDAAAFNMLESVPPDLETPPSQRPVGGLGIHLVKHLIDDIAYERRRGNNHLTLKQKLHPRR